MWGSGPFSMDPPSAGCVYDAQKSYREAWDSWSWSRKTWRQERNWRTKSWKSARRQWRRWRSDPGSWHSQPTAPFLLPEYEAYKHPIPRARMVEVEDHEHREGMLAWRWRGRDRHGDAFPWQDLTSQLTGQCKTCNPWATMVAMDDHDHRKETLAWKWRAVASSLRLKYMTTPCLLECRRGAQCLLTMRSDMQLAFQSFSM